MRTEYRFVVTLTLSKQTRFDLFKQCESYQTNAAYYDATPSSLLLEVYKS